MHDSKKPQIDSSNRNASRRCMKYGEPDLCDVILVVEGQKFHVHKMVLAARSKYFKSLFYGKFKEQDEDKIEIKQVSRVAFKRIMDFIYYGRIIDEILIFASSLNVTISSRTQKFRHNNKEIKDRRKYISGNYCNNNGQWFADFWKASSQMLQLADRVDIKDDFQKYFQRLLDCNICNSSNCFICVTIHIFGFVNDLFLDFNRYKKQDYNFIKDWLKYAEAAKIDQDEIMSQESVCEIETDTTLMEDPSPLPPIHYGPADLSDVILVVQGQEFHVHKMTLASRSKYFKAMFYGNFRETSENRIELQEVSRVAFKRLMNFVYHGRIIDNYSALTFFVTATDEGYGELKLEHCLIRNREGHIRNFFKASNEMMQLADRIDIKDDFKNYFQTLLDYHTCTTASCFVCLTIHIFGVINNLHLNREKHRQYDFKFVKEWLRFAKLAKICLDGSDVVYQMFTMLR